MVSGTVEDNKTNRNFDNLGAGVVLVDFSVWGWRIVWISLTRVDEGIVLSFDNARVMVSCRSRVRQLI